MLRNSNSANWLAHQNHRSKQTELRSFLHDHDNRPIDSASLSAARFASQIDSNYATNRCFFTRRWQASGQASEHKRKQKNCLFRSRWSPLIGALLTLPHILKIALRALGSRRRARQPTLIDRSAVECRRHADDKCRFFCPTIVGDDESSSMVAAAFAPAYSFRIDGDEQQRAKERKRAAHCGGGGGGFHLDSITLAARR